jgi:2-deoxy-D-gluconate 3-dehydrogenase
MRAVEALFDLSDDVAIVTGGNGGIGRAMAEALAAAGAAVVIAARNEAKNAATVGAIVAAGGRASAVVCDVTSRDDLEKAVDTALHAYGKLTVLVNNAGINRLGQPEVHSIADWDAVLETNLTAGLVAAQVAFPAMRAAGRGKVIMNGSEYSLFGAVNNPGYGASKGAIVALTKGLASAWGRYNIQVNAVLPGIIETELWGGSLENEAFRAKMVKRTPAGRVGEPADLRGITVFLASRASDFITGQSIAVDGGFCIADPLVFG